MWDAISRCDVMRRTRWVNILRPAPRRIVPFWRLDAPPGSRARDALRDGADTDQALAVAALLRCTTQSRDSPARWSHTAAAAATRRSDMRLRIWPFALLVVIGTGAAAPARAQSSVPDLEAEIRQRAAAIEGRLIAWRRDIDEHPELGEQETRTANLVA